MNYDQAAHYIQRLVTDDLVIIVGSGLSCAEGMPGMGELATHLMFAARSLDTDRKSEFEPIRVALESGVGLEAVLNAHPPGTELENWIVVETHALLAPAERKIVEEVVLGGRQLSLTMLMPRLLKPATSLHVLTTNYDRLVEVACEMSGWHVDTTTVGTYSGRFNEDQSMFASCKGITPTKPPRLDHFPRAVVLKPHGSIDWFNRNGVPMRCSMDLQGERLMVTPGLNKYRAGYSQPFDRQRELANRAIDRAARILVIGYGFNDDHLQTHLEQKISEGVPTLILCKVLSPKALELAARSPSCVGLSEATGGKLAITHHDGAVEESEAPIWQLSVMIEEILS